MKLKAFRLSSLLSQLQRDICAAYNAHAVYISMKNSIQRMLLDCEPCFDVITFE